MCVLLLSNKGLNIYGVSFFHFGRQEAQSKKMVTQLVKNLPAMRDTWIRSLGWKDPLQKGKATHSSILAWRIPWTIHLWSRKQLDTTEQLSLSDQLS